MSTPLSPPTRVELNKIKDELRTWTGAGTRMDDCYYGYDDEDCPARAKPIENAVIYHPPSRQFVRVQGAYVRVVALMPITANQLLKFRKIPCYKCYDPIKEVLPNEDLAWDNFQIVHSEPYSVYETPNVTNDNYPVNTRQKSYPNSFGTSTNLSWQLVDPDHYIE